VDFAAAMAGDDVIDQVTDADRGTLAGDEVSGSDELVQPDVL